MRPSLFLLPLFAFTLVSGINAADTPPPYNDPAPKRYNLEKRASEIDPQSREHPEIDFVFTDKKGKVRDLQHATVNTGVAPQGRLVIWLMDVNQGLFDQLSDYGLHAIQVSYANRWFGMVGKETLSDGTSLGKIRLEAATGEDFSERVSIPKPDGMTERSLQFVKWLAKENPQGKWEQFISPDGKSLRWEKVVMSGISHGSTTAARFAVHQKVARVVMFSGPRDQHESWQGFPSATPSNCYFGFTHVLDGGWTGDHYCRSWEMLGLHKHGPIVDVEASQPPFGNTRRLTTNYDVAKDANRAHSGVVPGKHAYKDASGKYLHEPVWRYLFTHPVDQSGSPVAMDEGCLKEQQTK